MDISGLAMQQGGMRSRTDGRERPSGDGQAKRPASGPTRRGVLVGAAVGVGLVAGYVVWPRKWPGGWQAMDREYLLNSWVRIAEDGQITVAVPQAEMGQGIYSGFAQIVADEMGADWAMMAAAPAPWHPVYANTGLAGNGGENLAAAIRPLAGRMGAEYIRRINFHLTAGSNSIRNYHDILQRMAAGARAELQAGAARQWGIPDRDVEARDGRLIAGKRTMTFAQAVRQLTAEDGPTVRPSSGLYEPQGGTLVGQPLPRLDLPPKVDGTARFGADVRLPGMVYAAVRHGPPGGRLRDVTGADGAEVVRGPNWVATTGITTFEARRALKSLAPVFDKGSVADSATRLESWRSALDRARTIVEEGRVDAASGPALMVEYRVPFLAHAAAEPMVATARITDGQVEVWGPTQSLSIAYREVARALGVGTDAVTIYPTLGGGSFGRKIYPDAMVEAALIAREIGKPVQLCWSRDEDFLADRYRPAAIARVRGRVDKGQVSLIDLAMATPVVPTVAEMASPPFWSLAKPLRAGSEWGAIEGAERTPYRLGGFRTALASVAEAAPIGYWQGASRSFTVFFTESFMDELADLAGEDPLAFRLAHLDGDGRMARVLRAVAEASGWGDGASAGMAFGVALHEAYGSAAATVIEAGVVDGRVRLGRAWCAVDCGKAVNPGSIAQQLEGGTIMGLSAALHEEVVFEDGRPRPGRGKRYRTMSFAEAPADVTAIVLESDAPFGGVAEIALPLAAPALANALFAATGRRTRSLPILSAGGEE